MIMMLSALDQSEDWEYYKVMIGNASNKVIVPLPYEKFIRNII